MHVAIFVFPNEKKVEIGLDEVPSVGDDFQFKIHPDLLEGESEFLPEDEDCLEVTQINRVMEVRKNLIYPRNYALFKYEIILKKK